MEALRDSGTLWLTRTSDIHTHLLVAASEGRPVQVTGPGFAVSGTFGMPDDGWTVFCPDPTAPIPLPRMGATIKVEYEGGRDSYTFFTCLTSIDGSGRWVFQAPLTVERTDRRMMARYNVYGVNGFCFRVTEWPSQPLLGLHDVSAGGAGIINDPRRHPLQFEQLLEGYMHVPGEDAIPMCVEVRNSRDFPKQAGLRIYGARITGIATVHQQQLVSFLAHWGRTHSG